MDGKIDFVDAIHHSRHAIVRKESPPPPQGAQKLEMRLSHGNRGLPEENSKDIFDAESKRSLPGVDLNYIPSNRPSRVRYLRACACVKGELGR